ncbi:MAG: rRNA maturation RNase YbeY [Terriglobia bacterium]
MTLRALRDFSSRVSRGLHLGRRYFDVTLVDDAAIAILNRDFRAKAAPTDVLSFPWQGGPGFPARFGDFDDFLGDIVISLDTAQRQATAERHSLRTEIEQLVLHGALHLLGYDHETDRGQMNVLELRLRRKLGIEGRHT